MTAPLPAQAPHRAAAAPPLGVACEHDTARQPQRHPRRRHQLSEDDVLGCAVFGDSIGVNGWPVEAHVKGDVEIRFHRGPEGVNQLPFRMIIPRAVDNLYVAGRCASMTHGGESAARVSGPCFAMGQAAGTAADLALKAGTSCRNVDYAQLRDRLTADGAYLGEER